MQQALSIALIIVAIIATGTMPAIATSEIPVEANAANTTPAKALNGNACTVEYLARGTYITQTAGKVGTINAYVNEPVTGKEYKTTIYRLNRRFYVTNVKDVAVTGEDAGGIVC
jgi:hypothetical protein